MGTAGGSRESELLLLFYFIMEIGHWDTLGFIQHGVEMGYGLCFSDLGCHFFGVRLKWVFLLLHCVDTARSIPIIRLFWYYTGKEMGMEWMGPFTIT